MPIGSGTLFLCIKVRSRENDPKEPPASGAPLGGVLSGTCEAFKHEIDRLTGCPGANREIDFLASLSLKGFQVRDGDGFHFDESAAIEGFDLENFPFGNDFAGFSIGSAADSRGCTE